MNHNSKLSQRFSFIIFTTSLIACVSSSHPAVIYDTHMHFVSKELVSAYKGSVMQASNLTLEKVSNKLFPINKTNTKLRWKTIKGDEHLLVAHVFEDNSKHEGKDHILMDQNDVWVTAFPELYDFCIDYMAKNPQANMSDIGLRMNQLLGLPANKVGYTLVEFWVRPSDLFRPCPDPDISTEQCGLHFPEGVAEEHVLWMNRLKAGTYQDAHIEYGGFPWTQLGYTYDWSPESKDNFGLSEYVIKKGSKVYIENVYTRLEYCQMVL